MIVEVPDDTSAGPILSTENCISIWTIGQYEGRVSFLMSDEEYQPKYDRVFEGVIRTGGKSLAFMTSSCNEIMKLNTARTFTAVEIFTNAVDYPTEVVCVIDQAK
jgi:hypothetical protein